MSPLLKIFSKNILICPRFKNIILLALYSKYFLTCPLVPQKLSALLLPPRLPSLVPSSLDGGVCSEMWNSFANSRVEICRNRHDQRSCKICASCVNFPGKQRNFSHNFNRVSRFTHTKCDFAMKLLNFYTLS